MKKLHQKIHLWYAEHGRVDLPWRKTDNIYHIYLSEVMLQQTQVNTVLERYYFPFLEKFPTLKALGEAPLDEVLKMWEGLGYYNRAKNLHKTAGSIERLPQSIEALMLLPGIGKNTAHAIATFGFKEPVPVMEANVKRILCRVERVETPTDTKLWKTAYAMVDRENSFDYNQAMMDIGATLCRPKNPKCHLCPLSDICEGKENPTRYPTQKKRTVPTRVESVMLLLYNGKLAMQQRSGKFLHGLWGFEATENLLCASEYLGEVKHAYTHFKLQTKVYLYHALERGEESYFSPEEIEKLAISKVDEKIVKLYLERYLREER